MANKVDPILGKFRQDDASVAKPNSAFVPYTGATGNVDLNDKEVDFNSTTFIPGYNTYAGLTTNIGEAWTFDDTLNGVYNGLNFSGDPIYEGANKKLGKSLFFNKTNAVTTPWSSNISIAGNWSISFWINISAFSGLYPFSIGNTFTGGLYGLAHSSAFRGFILGVVSSNGDQYLNSHPNFDYSLPTGWHHFVFTVNSSNKTYIAYTDGVQTNSDSYSGNMLDDTNYGFYLGGTRYGEDLYPTEVDFYFDELAFFKRQISSTEVGYLYNNGAALPQLEQNRANVLKVKAQYNEDGNFLITENNYVLPTNVVSYDSVNEAFTAPAIILNTDTTKSGIIRTNGGGMNLLIDPKKYNFLYTNESLVGAKDGQIVLGPYNKPATAANSTYVLGSNNDLSGGDEYSYNKTAVGSNNIINDGFCGTFGGGNTIYTGSEDTYIFGYGNLICTKRGGAFGTENKIGTNGVYKTSSFVFGRFGNITSDYSMLFSINDDYNDFNYVTNSKNKTILFSYYSSGQKDLLELECNKGVRIGATSGESIPMDGDDLYVKGDIEGNSLTTKSLNIISYENDTVFDNEEVVLG